MTRRRFVQCASAAGAAASVGLVPGRPARAQPPASSGAPPVLDAADGPIELRVARTPVVMGRRRGNAVTLNGSLPAPLLRFREGEEVVIRVHNALDEDTSIHWHGLIVPNAMDGVPQVNFPGIRPGETFEYVGVAWHRRIGGTADLAREAGKEASSGSLVAGLRCWY